jgi:hypothetical protein
MAECCRTWQWQSVVGQWQMRKMHKWTQEDMVVADETQEEVRSRKGHLEEAYTLSLFLHT